VNAGLVVNQRLEFEATAQISLRGAGGRVLEKELARHAGGSTLRGLRQQGVTSKREVCKHSDLAFGRFGKQVICRTIGE